MTVYRGQHYRTGETLAIRVAAGRIVAVDREPGVAPPLLIAPALFDLQINGAVGHAFNSAGLTTTQVREIVGTLRTHGVARFLPTLVTGAYSDIAAGLAEPRDTIEEVVEPYLIQLGLVARTARGRCLNESGWKHLGIAPPSGSQGGLFGLGK